MTDIKIDYDNIDVPDIMKQIQAKAASSTKKPSPPKKTGSPSKPALQIPEPEQVPLALPKWRRILLKLMKPFFPLIKLLILPVHHDLMQTVHNLNHVNKRLDYINTKTEQSLTKLSGELYSTSERLDLKIDRFNQSVNERLDQISLRLEDLDKTMEYVKTLHSLCHNIVVELTKLKIEEEGTKVKIRIMEKDFEFLSRKERALEKKAFK